MYIITIIGYHNLQLIILNKEVFFNKIILSDLEFKLILTMLNLKLFFKKIILENEVLAVSHMYAKQGD